MHNKLFSLNLGVTSCPSCNKAEIADRYGVLTLLEHEKEEKDMLIRDQVIEQSLVSSPFKQDFINEIKLVSIYVQQNDTLVRVFLCPCVGPFPSVGLTLTWYMG